MTSTGPPTWKGPTSSSTLVAVEPVQSVRSSRPNSLGPLAPRSNTSSRPSSFGGSEAHEDSDDDESRGSRSSMPRDDINLEGLELDSSDDRSSDSGVPDNEDSGTDAAESMHPLLRPAMVMSSKWEARKPDHVPMVGIDTDVTAMSGVARLPTLSRYATSESNVSNSSTSTLPRYPSSMDTASAQKSTSLTGSGMLNAALLTALHEVDDSDAVPVVRSGKLAPLASVPAIQPTIDADELALPEPDAGAHGPLSTTTVITPPKPQSVGELVSPNVPSSSSVVDSRRPPLVKQNSRPVLPPLALGAIREEFDRNSNRNKDVVKELSRKLQVCGERYQKLIERLRALSTHDIPRHLGIPLKQALGAATAALNAANGVVPDDTLLKRITVRDIEAENMRQAVRTAGFKLHEFEQLLKSAEGQTDGGGRRPSSKRSDRARGDRSREPSRDRDKGRGRDGEPDDSDRHGRGRGSAATEGSSRRAGRTSNRDRSASSSSAQFSAVEANLSAQPMFPIGGAAASAGAGGAVVPPPTTLGGVFATAYASARMQPGYGYQHAAQIMMPVYSTPQPMYGPAFAPATAAAYGFGMPTV